MKIFQFAAYIEKDNDSGRYVGIIRSVPGAHTYADTLDDLKKNLHEVVELCLENITEEEIKDIPEFIGTQQISVSL
ncbi:MAG: type II toxin-antitoxin system HicB family antitoxin [Chitinophagaceae bacterium]